MFTETAPYFSAKISCGDALGLFLLSAANSNSRGTHSIRRPGNESDEALSNGERLQGVETWQQIGAPVERIVSRLKEKADREDRGEVRNLPAGNTAPQGGFARRSGVS